ncbi:protein tincar, partial [Schistocerca serialis cubense]|uniref:protein tincar n=2 Tax=Schistocerca TaxID=7008 RepID=UPI00214EBA8A
LLKRRRDEEAGRGGCRPRANGLCSIWYGLWAGAIQAFLAVQGAQRSVRAASALGWSADVQAQVALCALAALLLPLLVAAACCRVGNLANDGAKLGRHLGARPDPALAASSPRLWAHGGPTAPFLHLASAFCLLLPTLLLDARLLHEGLLPREAIWHTDLDFVVGNRDRLVVLSFLSTTPATTPLSVVEGGPTVGSASDGNSSAPATGGALPTPQPLTATNMTTSVPPAARLAISGDQLREPALTIGPVSAEFANYAAALLVYAVRYPAVFWHTNKAFGALFSLQLLANGVQSLLAYAGVCVLYKVQVVGAAEALPILGSNESPFLLNPLVTLALYVLSSVLVLASSLVLYLYGYGRFLSFVHAEQERRAVLGRRPAARGWGYFTHCAALCALLAIAVCNAPLLHDYTAVYRGSLDGAVLACVVGGISHLLLWVLLWLLLTIKRRWAFRLRVSVARAEVRSPRSVRLVADVKLSSRDAGPGAPLLVIGNGRTYAITESSPKRAIMSVVHRVAAERKPKAAQSIDDINEEQVYWLRPKPPSPKTSPDSDRLTWLNRKLSTNTKHKVTFDDSLSTSKKGKCLLAKSPKSGSKGKKGPQNGLEQESEDDGDYATLRELPRAENEENKLLDSASREDSSSTYGLTNKDLTPGDYEDPSPLLTPEPHGEPSSSHPVTAPVTVSVHNSSEPNQLQSMETPRCLRRADSGMPHDELTPRSDSVSTESSGGSPPCGNHSETSSGVHSNSSSENQPGRRSTSVDDLPASEQNPRTQPPWRSFSLQRNVQPPTSNTAVLNQTSGSAGAAPPSFGFSGVAAMPSTNAVIATDAGTVGGCPAVLLENAAESTVVIRRKQVRPKTSDGTQSPVLKDEPFGRSTNMRMTSFTDNPDGSRPEQENFPSSSSTLPHYPTQPIPMAAVYPHCSTMPLPSSTSGSIVHNTTNSSGTGSCHLFPRQHTTIPTHHNGVRLFSGPNPFVKRFPPYHHQVLNGRPPHIAPPLGPLVAIQANSKTCGVDPQNSGIAVHHTFPQITPVVKYNPQQLLHKQDRDSANFSMASSGDSDQYLPHN